MRVSFNEPNTEVPCDGFTSVATEAFTLNGPLRYELPTAVVHRFLLSQSTDLEKEPCSAPNKPDKRPTRLRSSLSQKPKKVADAVNFYNRERPYQSCGMLTPDEAAHCPSLLHKKWKSAREDYLKSLVSTDA